MEMVDGGMVDKDAMIRDLLNWMSEAEAIEFAEQNGYDDPLDEDLEE
jgi:hypothetical protein